MHKALQVELQDWQRDQEPDTDHEGFYQTSLPTIITQVNMPYRYTISKATHSHSVWPVGTPRTKLIPHALHVFCVDLFVLCVRCLRRMPGWLWWLDNPYEIRLYRWGCTRWRTSLTGVGLCKFSFLAACQPFYCSVYVSQAWASLHFHLHSFTSQVSRSSGGIWEGASQGSEQQQKQVLPPLSSGLHQQLHHPQVRSWHSEWPLTKLSGLYWANEISELIWDTHNRLIWCWQKWYCLQMTLLILWII